LAASLNRVNVRGVDWGGSHVLPLITARDTGTLLYPLGREDGKVGPLRHLRTTGLALDADSFTREGRRWFAADTRGKLIGFQPVEDSVELPPFVTVDLPSFGPGNVFRGGNHVQVNGRLAVVEQRRGGTPLNRQTWIVDLERQKMVRHFPQTVAVAWDAHAWRVDGPQRQPVLAAINPADGGERTFAFPADPVPLPLYVQSVHQVGESLVAVTGAMMQGGFHPGRQPHQGSNALRLDAWHRQTGQHQRGRLLPVSGDNADVRWHGDSLLLADESTVQAIDIARWLAEEDRELAPIKADPALFGKPVTAALQSDHERARVSVGRAEGALMLRVDIDTPRVLPRTTAGPYAEGHGIEVAITQGDRHWRFSVAAATDGKAAIDTLGNRAVSLSAEVHHDPLAGRATYLLALPWGEGNPSANSPLGLSIAHHADDVGAGRSPIPQRSHLLGEALTGTALRPLGHVKVDFAAPPTVP
jgi:hypothetical protein